MTLLGSTLAYCPECQTTEHARIVAKEGGVFMERLCPRIGVQSIKIATDHRWYMNRMDSGSNASAIRDPYPSKRGCPFDCGPCQWHTGAIHVPIVAVNGDHDFTSVDSIRTTIAKIVERTGGVQLINLAGDEPTLHPHFFEVLEACQHERIGRIIVSTSGQRVAQEKGFAERIKDAGVQLELSVDTFIPERSRDIHGRDITAEKHEALRILERLDIPTSIRVACLKGMNEDEVAAIAHTYLKKNFVRNVTIQNMPTTGRNDGQFEARDHVTVDDLESLLVSKGEFSRTDFLPLSTYHPRCYSVAYCVIVNGSLLSLSHVLDRQTLMRIAENRDVLRPDENLHRALEEGLNRIGVERGDDNFIKAVYLHAYMDGNDFDVDRASRCGDMMTDETGRMIPVCTFNLLYRQRGHRFLSEVTEAGR